METMHQHQLRPKIYYIMGLGWTSDRWYDQGTDNKKINNKLNH